MKAPATPEGRGSKLKQARLPFATSPRLESEECPAKKPRLEESEPEPEPPLPPMAVDDFSENVVETDEPEPEKCDETLDESAIASEGDKTESSKKPNRESAKKREEKEKKRQERERERLSRREAKRRELEEKEERKKRRELKRLEREEAKKKEQEEKEQKKLSKIKIKEYKESCKEKEKLRKIEMTEKRNKEMEEEKLRKEREKEKIENKKKKAAAAFKSFFVAKDRQNGDESFEEGTTENLPHAHNFLSNFTVKSDMRLAPVARIKLNDDRKNNLDKLMSNQSYDMNSSYLASIKKDNSTVKSSGKTWPIEDLKNDLIIIEDDLPPVEDTKEDQTVTNKKSNTSMRAKLFSFAENRRPPYWGTWQRKSEKICGRKPFAIDSTLLDYDCDSDEEWEEEEPGESVESIAGSDDEEGDNEYDVDNDFMVPHGYLSDEEALGEDENALSPEALKAKLQFLEHEFEDEMKKPTKVKKPRLIGVIWQNSEGRRPDTCPELVWDFLALKSMITSESEIIIHSSNINTESYLEEGEKSASKKNKKFPDELIPDLMRLVHGNVNSRGFLVKEFQEYISNKNDSSNSETKRIDEKSDIPKEISNISIAKKIKEFSTWMPCSEEGPMYSRMCWFIEKEVREKFNMEHLQLPNDWSYSLTPKNKNDFMKKEKPISENKNSNKESPPKKENSFNITKFTKKLSKEERHKQFTSPAVTNLTEEKTTSNMKEETSQSVEKKRVSLKFLGPRDKTNTNSPATVANKSDQSTNNEQKNIEKGKTEKKRVSLLSSAPLKCEPPKPCRTNLLTQFIKTAKEKYAKTCSESEADDCIVLSE